jgi:glycosyltransferase involved in cell wall biosynthesis
MVTFAGPQPQEAVARLMRESALLVLTSRAEAMANVLIEALASGTPVVATRSGGPEEFVQDGVGLLVPTEDPGAVADAIASMLRNRENYPPAALRDYAMQYSWENVAERLHDIYREAVGAR